MQVAQNKYLSERKPLLSRLLSELLATYEYASVLATDSVSKAFSVSGRGINVSDHDMFHQRGIVVRIYYKGRYYEYSFNELSEARITHIMDEIAGNLLTLAETVPSGGGFRSFPPPEDDPVAFTKRACFKSTRQIKTYAPKLW